MSRPMTINEVILSVCNQCGARSGEHCVKMDGLPRKNPVCNPHKVRWDKAWAARDLQKSTS